MGFFQLLFGVFHLAISFFILFGYNKFFENSIISISTLFGLNLFIGIVLSIVLTLLKDTSTISNTIMYNGKILHDYRDSFDTEAYILWLYLSFFSLLPVGWIGYVIIFLYSVIVKHILSGFKKLYKFYFIKLRKMNER